MSHTRTDVTCRTSSSARIEPLESRVMFAVEPLMSQFMGINGHASAGFDPSLYKPAVSLVRDYHNFNWDVGTDSSYTTTFPYARNGVNWDKEYGGWVAGGFTIDACIQFSGFTDSNWVSLAADAYKYGKAFATHFGSSGVKLVTTVEIGNEDGQFSDAVYKVLFQNMAQGIRDGDPNMRIATMNLTAGASGQYARSVNVFTGMENLVDIWNTHSYPFLNLYPTWQRSYPEDARLTYLTDVQNIINWQQAHDPTAVTWVTEFGYDSSTQPPPTSGTFKDFRPQTDTQMAQWLVRSWLNFSAMDLERAYMFYYNDKDQPTLFGGSGLTRNFVPKPAYYAVANLQSELGDYRFVSAVQKNANGVYVFQYQRNSDPSDIVWAVWSATGNGTSVNTTLTGLPGTVTAADLMPLTTGGPTAVSFTTPAAGSVNLNVGESVTYLHMAVNASIKGVVFTDVNGNGVQDAGDTVRSGVTVWDDVNSNGIRDVNETWATTDVAGGYTLTKLLPGSHNVRADVTSPWVQTTSGVMTLAAGQQALRNIGVRNTTVISPVTLQGESGVLSGGTVVAKNHAGYLGTGFADFGGKNSAVQWTLNVASAGSFKFDFRYANGGSGNRSCTLQINGVNVGTIAFAKTGSWSTWLVTSINANLKAGSNTIKLVAGSAGGPNLDQVVISPVTAGAVTLAVDTKKKLLASL